MATVARVLCDLCKEQLQGTDEYCSAGTYGIEGHLDCIKVLSPLELMRVLGLDEISHGPFGRWDPVARWWIDGSERVRTHASVPHPRPETIKARVQAMRADGRVELPG